MTPEQTPKLWECPACGFVMAACHHDPTRADPCPACAELALRAERSQLTETIALDMRIIDRLRAENAELRAALELSQRWLANSVPTTVLDGPKPLPIISALLAAKPAPVAVAGE